MNESDPIVIVGAAPTPLEVLEFFQTSTGAMSTTHPVNPIRLKSLQYFKESATYKAAVAGKKLKDDQDLE